MEIDTNISIEIDEDDFATEIDLDGRIESGVESILENKVDEAVFEAMEEIRRQMRQATITEDRVREIVRDEITKSINGVGMVLASMIGPKENNNA